MVLTIRDSHGTIQMKTFRSRPAEKDLGWVVGCWRSEWLDERESAGSLPNRIPGLCSANRFSTTVL